MSSFYDEVGGSPIGVIRRLFTDPGVVLGALVESHDIVYLVWLGVPLLFLFDIFNWPFFLRFLMGPFRRCCD